MAGRFTENELRNMLRGACMNAGRRTSRCVGHRWAFLADSLGVGSTWARRLCVELGIDPDEQVGAFPDEDEEE